MREVVEDGREIEPAPPDNLEVGEVCLPLAPFGFFASYLGRRLANSAILSTCVTVMLRAISVIQMGFSVDNYMLDPAQVRQCDDFVAPANEPPTSFSESPPTLR